MALFFAIAAISANFGICNMLYGYNSLDVWVGVIVFQ
jgi:hypothetical protein